MPNDENGTVVVTGINGITEGIRMFAEQDGWTVTLVEDRKSPEVTSDENVEVLSVSDQEDLDFALVDQLGYDHYSRKNLGYLQAIRKGVTVIGDTDDDNIPYDGWGRVALDSPESMELVTAPSLANVYALFTDTFVWPRGFPLDSVSGSEPFDLEDAQDIDVAIWQGLADIEPDVDALHRLLFDQEIKFAEREPVALGTGVHCPINSQNTIWIPRAFPYLYLPIHVSFRFTDILRGYVAQFGVQATGAHVGFTGATVYQERNPHNLMDDFESEVPVYLKAGETISVLQETQLAGEPLRDLPRMYRNLSDAGIVPSKELNGVDAWLNDIEMLQEEGAL